MSTDEQTEELARRVRGIMTRGSIVGGPSREELFDGLKYFMLPIHAVSFKVNDSSSSVTVEVRGYIYGIERHGDSMDDWCVKFKVNYVTIGGGYSGSIRRVSMNAHYNTKLRAGNFFPDMDDMYRPGMML